MVALWQVGLMGYTYVVAGHAAREGARQLAVDPTDGPKEFPYRDVAARGAARRRGATDARIEKKGDGQRPVNVNVPLFIPGLKTPWRVELDRDDLGRGRGAAAHPGAGRRRRRPTPEGTSD